MSAFLCLEISSSPIECHFALLHSMPESEGINTNPYSQQFSKNDWWELAYEHASSLTLQVECLCGVCVYCVQAFLLQLSSSHPGDSWLSDTAFDIHSLLSFLLPNKSFALDYLSQDLSPGKTKPKTYLPGFFSWKNTHACEMHGRQG